MSKPSTAPRTASPPAPAPAPAPAPTTPASYRVASPGQLPSVQELAGYLDKDPAVAASFLDWFQGTQSIARLAVEQIGIKGLEFVLELSAQQVAGPRRPGHRTDRHPAHPYEPHQPHEPPHVRWHGTQPGVVGAGDRKLRLQRPRLRTKPTPDHKAREVDVPAYQKLREDPDLSGRVVDILLQGVSTRNYQSVVDPMARAVGIGKSSISRAAVQAGAGLFKKLCERDFTGTDILVVFLDGLRFGAFLVLVAVGVDADGHKHVLGIKEGTSENATVATELLEELVARGLRRDRKRLFVIDGSKALRQAIDAVFGPGQPVQRCRLHKLRNVKDHLPEGLAYQAAGVMKAAFQLEAAAGIAKVKRYAQSLEQAHPSAAASMQEGLEELFTVQTLGLPGALARSLTTTNIIENNQSGLRGRIGRVKRWRSGQMVRRWVAAAALAQEKKFRRVRGYQHLPVLQAALGPAPGPGLVPVAAAA